MRVLRASIITVVAVLSLYVCSSLFLETADAETANAISEINWTYQGETGPDFWADLDTDFAACKSGQSQSPIDLTGAKAVDLLNPEFHYEPVPLNLLNNGHTVQVPYAPGSYLMLEGQRYDLLQFHFHSPSEHAIDGQSEPVELHLVHRNEVGELAVVAVLLHADEVTGAAYQLMSQNLPYKAGDKVRTDATINAEDLLPQQTTTYRYSGSLTTPPCSESVTWLVMSQPVSLPNEQLTQYEKLLNHNNRPLQSLHKRSIQLDASS
ncbi:MAG: carbonic anhydrase [Phormidesmis sp.]